MSSSATHVLVPLSALPVLEQHAPILGDFYLAGEVSCYTPSQEWLDSRP